MQREQRSVIYPEGAVPFTLIRSARRSFAVSVESSGEVLLRVPLAASERAVGMLLEDKKDWILRHYKERLEASGRIRELRNRLPLDEDAGGWEAFVSKSREAAKRRFAERAAYFVQLTGVSYERITVRDQKTRWGSCSSKGTLSFNWRLLLAPPEVLDYVVVHELCHLTCMNHGREFWRAVEAALPDYKERRNWLREHGAELMALGRDRV